ncbi:DUF6152 family protein [Chelativorans sp. Marseille-P2723]|uniref:DUF6152 family protein n=1 Tax=Chelativorans sp. Marseille-P2723 TaxID=2709133 RepID=UPI00156DEED2|nr:DUF6152 family protein [Chelativorans sp. Marseille-P2723]
MALNPQTIIAAFYASALFATAALAHHGWSWAEGELSELNGTIQEISFAPPHPSLVVDVDGQIWQVDLANPAQTKRSGFVPGSAEVGDEVTVLGNRSLDKSKNLIKAVRITISGKNYDLYPDRITN